MLKRKTYYHYASGTNHFTGPLTDILLRQQKRNGYVRGAYENSLMFNYCLKKQNTS